MKKNVFSRTLAVLASMTVLGAASMISASAAGEEISISGATGAPGETVTVQVAVACNDKFESFEGVIAWEDTALTAATPVGANGASVTASVDGSQIIMNAYGSAAIADGAVASIDFTIPADAEVGTTYTLNWSEVSVFAEFEGDDLAETVAQTPGTIEVVAGETEAPEEPTEAPVVTDAPVVTEAPAATTVKATTKASTGSPKTGSAGVAVAVAGLVTAGATAVVLKKRH